MAKLNNWDIVALASYGASWILIIMGVLGHLPPMPWAWLALMLGIWPTGYVIGRYFL